MASATGLYCGFENDLYSKDASFNNVSILNDIKVNSLTTDKTRILNDGSLEVYFAGTPALPTKAPDSWWSVINELSEIDEHLLQIDLSITGHTTALSEVNLATIAATQLATAAQTTATNALTLSTTNSAAITALTLGMVGTSFTDTIKQTITTEPPINIDENIKISLNIDSEDFEVTNNNLTFSNSFYTTFHNMQNNINNNILNIEQLNDDLTTSTTNINNDINNIHTTTTNLNNHLNTTDNNLETTNNNLTNHINIYNSKVATIDTNISTLQTGLNTANTNITSLQTGLSTSNTNITTLQTGLSTANTNISTLQTGLSTANTNISTLQTNLSTANTNISNLQTNLNTANTNISTLQTGLSTANTNISNLQTNLNDNYYTKTQIDTNIYTKSQSDFKYYNKTEINNLLTNVETEITDVQNRVSNLETLMRLTPKTYKFSFMPSNQMQIATLNNESFYYYQLNLGYYSGTIILDTSNFVQQVKFKNFHIQTYIRDGWLQKTNGSDTNLQFNSFDIVMSTPHPGPSYGSSDYTLDLNIRTSLINNPNLNQIYNGGNGFIIRTENIESLLFLTKMPTFMNCIITSYI